MHKLIAKVILLLAFVQFAGCDKTSNSQTYATDPVVPASSVTQKNVPLAGDGGDQQVAQPVNDDQAEVKVLDWDALVPEGWRPDALMDDYNVDELSDDDPRAQELLAKLKAAWKKAPAVPELEGQRVKLPGFVVPLEMDAKKIEQFLLVPYYGACIHVPPPPANQTVHVVSRAGKAYEGKQFDTVWVTGTMRIERLSSKLAEAGYRIEDAIVTPYE